MGLWGDQFAWRLVVGLPLFLRPLPWVASEGLGGRQDLLLVEVHA